MFNGVVVPDGYGVLQLPGRTATHLLLELDRGSEPRDRLRDKARRYERVLPSSQLADERTLLLFAVSTRARAGWASEALRLEAASCRSVVWTSASHDQTLAVVTEALQ